MTGGSRLDITQPGINFKNGLCRMLSAIRQGGDVCISLAGNIAFALIKAQLSLGLVRTHDNRAGHAIAGSGTGTRP